MKTGIIMAGAVLLAAGLSADSFAQRKFAARSGTAGISSEFSYQGGSSRRACANAQGVPGYNHASLEELVFKKAKWAECAELSGKDLSAAALQGVDLNGSRLKGADLSGSKMGGAKLNGAQLLNARLNSADLGKAELRGVDLFNAELSGADLSGADLRGADLRWAKLDKTNLRGADLRDADLSRVDLSKADLTGADLRGATLHGAKIRKADLSLAKYDRKTVLPFAPEQASRFQMAFVGLEPVFAEVQVAVRVPVRPEREAVAVRASAALH